MYKKHKNKLKTYISTKNKSTFKNIGGEKWQILT